MSSAETLQRRSGLYKQYKEASSRLVCWLVNTSNRIIGDLANRQLDEPIPALNTTGQVRPAEIVTLAELIAKYRAVPSAISTLLGRIIQLRTQTADEFARELESNPADETLRKNNEGHRHFIDILRMAHTALSSCSAEQSSPSKSEGSPKKLEDTEDDVDDILFRNFFDALRVDDPEEEEIVDPESPEPENTPSRPQRKKNGKKRPKGSGKGKKAEAPQPKRARVKALDLPLEAYRVVHEGCGFESDYLVAVYDLLREAANLRLYLQDEWWRVAYHGQVSAVVGSMSEIAVKMVQEAELEIFVDFPEPGHDCYDAVVKTLTRGDMDEAERLFRVDMTLANVTVVQTRIDLREHLCWYAYRDLLAFAEDFQQNRTGKPTKRMQKEIAGWDPKLDLKSATKEERIQWRRVYTINWLYDLVNVFASVTARKHIGKDWVLEEVDWSPEGPWGEERRIWGTNVCRFAGFVTDIAYKKPGTDIRSRIRPHHVFQLQCIIDSYAVSRGWSMSLLTGHVLSEPANDYDVMRDIENFLDRKGERPMAGYLHGVPSAELMMKRRRCAEDLLRTMDHISLQMLHWLGNSRIAEGFDDVPTSRFAATDPNGLHTYSPYLCGAGLAEALSLTSMYGLALWDQCPEVVCIVHIYNMLDKKGFLKRPDPLLFSVMGLWEPAFFKDGKHPTENFADAVWERFWAEGRRNMNARLDAMRAKYKQSQFSLTKFADAGTNTFFNRNTLVTELIKADWVLDRVPDSYLTDERHSLPWVCAIQRHEGEQALRQRTEQLGFDWQRMKKKRREVRRFERPGGLGGGIGGGISASFNGARDVSIAARKHGGLSSRSVLEYCWQDLQSEICGMTPRLALNHVSLLLSIFIIFSGLETAIDGKVRTEEQYAGEDDGQRRIEFTLAVLQAGDRGDDEVLQKLADNLERISHFHHIYWKKLYTPEEVAHYPCRPNPDLNSTLQVMERNGECCIM